MRWRPSLLIALLMALAHAGNGAEFRGLGDLSGGGVRSEAADVSANGLVVVGSSRSSNGREAFRWTRETGIVGLGDLPGGEFDSFATAVSADGSVVVGGGTQAPDPPMAFHWINQDAFRWTADNGLESITDGGWLVDSYVDGHARAVSADGTIVIGEHYTINSNYAFHWTVARQMVEFRLGYFRLTPNDVSADGTLIVGDDYLLGAWVDAEGAHHLQQTIDRPYNGLNAVSPDGTVMGGGSGRYTYEPEATLWTERGTKQIVIGDLPGGQLHSEVLGLSLNGGIAVGFGHSESGKEAFISDEANGMRSLQGVLVDELGLDLDGWRLESAPGVSDDGTVIVGTGVHDGVTEGFIVVIPEPHAIAWGVGMMVIATWRPFRRMRWRGERP